MPDLRAQVVTTIHRAARRARRVTLPAPLRKLTINWQYPDGPDRLVPSPVFVLSPSRSGSTLLRMVLDSHSRICAPHEMHLNRLTVKVTQPYARKGIAELGLTSADLEDLLWDRVLHRQLVLSRKAIMVDKTPHNVANWQRISRAWPQARYLFLLRHPAAIARSHAEARPHVPVEVHERGVLWYGKHIAEARAQLPGLTVKYEDLAADPEQATRRICRWLGIRWERSMLDYGRVPRRSVQRGIGDWSGNIRSGRIQRPRAAPEPPDSLRALTTAWGY